MATKKEVAFSKTLRLINPISGGDFNLDLVEPMTQTSVVKIPSWQGVHTLVEWVSGTTVTQAIAFTGFRVRLLDRQHSEGCGDEARVTLTIDDERVIDKRSLKDCDPCDGHTFNTEPALFKAATLSGEQVGVFLPNGSIVKLKLSGLKKTESKPIVVEVVLDMARYTTEPL